MEIFAAGDSFNDLAMIRQADGGCLFRAPEAIQTSCQDLACVQTFDELLDQIDSFLAANSDGLG